MPYDETLHLLYTLFFTLFGSLLGSFSNVVILRMATGKSVIFPPSACPACNHRLFASDLLPVFSWLFLRGRCRYCQAPISCQYPLVEAFIAAIVGLSFYKTGGHALAFVVLATRMVIWFIASVIFLRNEVQRPEPFLWAIMFFILLNFPIGGCPFIDRSVLLVPLAAVIIGLVASLKNQATEIFKWGGLSFLMLFSLKSFFGLYPAILPALLAIMHISGKFCRPARIAFFATQLISIACTLLL